MDTFQMRNKYLYVILLIVGLSISRWPFHLHAQSGDTGSSFGDAQWSEPSNEQGMNSSSSGSNPFAIPLPAFENPNQQAQQSPQATGGEGNVSVDPAIKSTDEREKEQAQKQARAEQFAQLIMKAVAKEAREDLEGAVALYDEAYAIDPDSIVVLVRRSICLAKLGRHKEAADGFDLATNPRTRPRTVSDFSSLAWLRATSPIPAYRDGALAVTYAQRALKESESAEHYDVLAAAYAEMGEFQKAKDTLEAGMKFFSESSRLPDMRERLVLYRKKMKYREDWRPVTDAARERDLEAPGKKKKWWQW